MYRVLKSVYQDLDGFETKTVEVDEIEAVEFKFNNLGEDGEIESISYGLTVEQQGEDGNTYFLSPVHSTYSVEDKNGEDRAKSTVKTLFLMNHG